MEIKLSILILTHNRPSLFKRCINSVYVNKPNWVEVLVNNDSNDIIEEFDAKYFYIKNDDLSYLYKFLFNKSTGKYIYFLEDDDYLLPNFWDIIELNNSIYNYIPDQGYLAYLDYFIKRPNFEEYFQLGQIIFEKKLLINFPEGNYIKNDFYLYKEISKKTKFKYIKKPIYQQTTDGKDNISFKEYNKDERFYLSGKK
jgi:glycosyltransferase involved in cell wall biosynthesis